MKIDCAEFQQRFESMNEGILEMLSGKNAGRINSLTLAARGQILTLVHFFFFFFAQGMRIRRREQGKRGNCFFLSLVLLSCRLPGESLN